MLAGLRRSEFDYDWAEISNSGDEKTNCTNRSQWTERRSTRRSSDELSMLTKLEAKGLVVKDAKQSNAEDRIGIGEHREELLASQHRISRPGSMNPNVPRRCKTLLHWAIVRLHRDGHIEKKYLPPEP